MAAAKGMLEEEHGAPRTPATDHDQNTYVLGGIGKFKIVVACLPKDRVGSVSAAVVGRDMLSTFPKIRLGLLVGIGAGIPSDRHDIRLGDVVIGSDEASGGVVVYDIGTYLADGSFESISHLNRSTSSFDPAIDLLKAHHKLRQNFISEYVDAMLKRYPRMRKSGYGRPLQSTDRLFNMDYKHSAGRTCDQCDRDEEGDRKPRHYEESVIHYGTIATGNSVIKHAPTREQLKYQYNAICLEMEAAGLMNNFPCIVIRGISDYADSHKNDHWHAYAAAAAAACAKELLQFVTPKEIDMTRPAR